MKALLLISGLLMGLLAHAGEAQVTVLETPFFREPDASSKVIQYARQGETIYIHPAELTEESGGEFVRSKDHQGRDAWVLRKHVHIWYQDAREMAQKTLRPDPTDYRLYEPLPEGYPLRRPYEARAWAQIAYTSPWAASYPYREKQIAEAYSQNFEFSGAFMRKLDTHEAGRWWGGPMMTIRHSHAEYVLSNYLTQEDWMRIGFGGVASYDAYRSEKNRINLISALLVYPYAQATIDMQLRSQHNQTDRRSYGGWNAGARLGAQWQRVNILSNLDMVMGLWGELESPLSMRSKNTAQRPTWWRHNKGDTFGTGFNFTLAAQIGLQSSY